VNRKDRVLFFSTGDATRSQIAEAFLRTYAGQRFDVVSTAVKSTSVHELTRDVMSEAGIDISSQVARSVAESLKDRFTYVVTICDAAHERHPIFPFARRMVHWSITDPAGAGASAQQGFETLRCVRDEIRQHVNQFIAETGQLSEGTAPPPKQHAPMASEQEAT